MSRLRPFIIPFGIQRDTSYGKSWVVGWLIIAGVLLGAVPAASPQGAEPGAALYYQYCASCHGERGAGDGPYISYLTVRPADLTRIAARRGGTFPRGQITRIVSGEENPSGHGNREMPVWGEKLQEDVIGGVSKTAIAQGRISLLVDYLEALQPQPKRGLERQILPLGEPPPSTSPQSNDLIIIPFGK